MNNIFITIKKELRSIFRDKKTLLAMFIYPILIPAMVILYGQIGEITDEEQETYIGVNYSLSAEEKALLKEMHINYTVYDDMEAMEKAYENKEINCYISQEKPREYVIYANESNTDGMIASEMSQSYLDAYSDVLTASYLVEHDIDIEEAYSQLSYDIKPLDSNNYMVTVLLAVSLTYTILAICIASSNVAISTTATEKENGTLETILTFPIKKSELITGKYLSSVVVGFISALISLILMIISFKIGSAKFAIFEGLTISTSFASILGCIVVCLMAAVFISGIAMFLTAFSQSYKEAQSKIGLINFVGTIPMFVSILNVEITKVYYLIPICNYEQTLQDLLLSSTNITNVLLVVTSTIVYSFIIIKLIINLYNSEKILFNN